MSAGLLRQPADLWRKARRYAVPRAMIERATERRLAGDWPGACAAAGVDVEFDPATAGEAAADLAELAPDLLRWHLPRTLSGRTPLQPGRSFVLARYGVTALRAHTPAAPHGPQRLRLTLGTEPSPDDDPWSDGEEDWSNARHLWSAADSVHLLARVGGGRRAPFFEADGTPRPAALPDDGDPAVLVERVTLLQDAGEFEAAFTAAGVVPAFERQSFRGGPGTWIRRQLTAAAIARLAAEAEHDGLAACYFSLSYHLEFELVRRDGAWTGRIADNRPPDPLKAPLLAQARWRRPIDLDLLRTGRIGAADLHPLVAASLFPEAAPAPGPAPAAPPPVLRVRCGREWHEMGYGVATSHSEEERRRERALRAFGGTSTGCFAVEESWLSGQGRLPRRLRELRDELFQRAHHGDTDGVLALLDAGIDPRVRTPGGTTLLHVLNLLDHERLLPRLLAAGLDVDAEDQTSQTPLYVAAAHGGSVRLVRDLLAAGARIDTVADTGMSLRHVVKNRERDDLAFLADQVDPLLGEDYWIEEYP